MVPLNKYPLDESVGFMMSQTYRKLTQWSGQCLKEYGLTTEQWSVLYRIGKYDGINQKEIAQRAAKDQPTTARILDGLLQKGLIEKMISPVDRRAYLVYLTEAGRALLAETIPVERQALAEAVRGIEPERLDMLKEILWQIKENAEKLAEK